MSAPSPGQLRPNSAIYLGAAAVPSDDLQSTPPTSPNSPPLLSPGGTTVLGRIPHLPSPPHTSSTSGSAGEREKEGHTAGRNVVGDTGIRSKQRVILPAVVIMQNGEQDHHGFDNDPKRIYHQQQHFEPDMEDRTARIQPKRSLAEKNKEVRLYRITLDILFDYMLTGSLCYFFYFPQLSLVLALRCINPTIISDRSKP
jgi:hypothetical protein